MGKAEKNFLNKHMIDVERIKYITRSERKTVIHMENGYMIESFCSMKGIAEELPQDLFLSINKGVIISKKYLVEQKANTFIMVDGEEFKGRVHYSKPAISSNQWQRYSILDDMPLAFCVIELVFDDNGKGMDFIFRYCNKEMEVLEGKTIAEMINKSFYEVFENGDKKWLVTYADVALNGSKKIIESYSPEIGANLRIYCYQPKASFCACTLVKI